MIVLTSRYLPGVGVHLSPSPDLPKPKVDESDHMNTLKINEETDTFKTKGRSSEAIPTNID